MKTKEIMKMIGDICTGYLLHMGLVDSPEILWVVLILLIIPRVVFLFC